VVLVTISGHPGSGTSTLVELLEKTKGWTSINGGEIFRNIAKKRGMTLKAFGELCEEDPVVDKELDQELIKKICEKNGPDIVESRLAGHWAQSKNIDCHKIWLDVDAQERAKRASQREGTEWTEQLQKNNEREAVDGKRFLDFYNIDINDMKPYSIVINSTNMNADEVLNTVLSKINEK